MDVFLNLPLELFRAILAQAMLARGVKRALRLRLVSSKYILSDEKIQLSRPEFFSAEVLGLLGELKLLDDPGKRIRDPKIATEYLSQRLLGTQTPLSPRLDKIREIAWQLASEDTDRKQSYIDNVRNLSFLVPRESRPNSAVKCSVDMREWFHDELPDGYQSYGQQCDLLTASICTGRLDTFRKLCGRQELPLRNDQTGLLGNPYTAAALADDFTFMDALLCQLKKQCLGYCQFENFITDQIFPTFCELASPKTVETLLESHWCSFLRENPGDYSNFHAQRRLATPSLETFDVIRRFVNPPCDRGLATLLWKAAGRGWEEMTLRLLELGAPTDDEWIYNHWRNLRVSNRQKPLAAACKLGSCGTVKHLLQFEASVGRSELAESARRGQYGMAKALVEHGVDVNHHNSATRPPIFSAILLEHTEMFRFLIERGAALGDDCTAMVKEAKEQGLESMLELIESTSLDQRRVVCKTQDGVV